MGDYDAGLDNQIATYLMIDPVHGFAPPEFVQLFHEKKYYSSLIRVSTFRYQKQVGKVTSRTITLSQRLLTVTISL